jgi:hypothetical protein
MVSYSCQSKSTDTIAVDGSNSPFRDETGGLLFRQWTWRFSENLNDLDADIVFKKH